MVSRVWLWLALLCLSACGSDNVRDVRDGNAAMVTTTEDLRPPDSTSATGAYEGIPEYLLGAGDKVDIEVFGVKKLTRSLRINSRGMITLPLLGPIKAAGKTNAQLEEEITSLLADDFMQDPQVTVFVSEYESQKVTVEGAVKTPGIYPLTRTTSLLQAIVGAGGVTDMANKEGVIIFRVIDGKRMAAVFDLNAIRGGNAEDPRVYGDDLIVIDQSGTKSAWGEFLKAVPLAQFFYYF